MKKTSSFVLFVLLFFSACTSGLNFKVEGEISEADGKMLYLEASALEGIVALDSVKLKRGGSFSFRQKAPESPEFYRLRLDDRIINFSVDSTETIRVDASYAEFSTAYLLEGSVNSEKIKQLTLMQMALQSEVDALAKAMQVRQIGVDVFEDSLMTLLNNYKNEVKLKYIFSAPNTAAAYFALFQKLNNYLIFDPLNSREDIKCFAAVATSLNNYYPHADRSKNLYNIVIKGMKNTREPQQKIVEFPENVVTETGIIEISLRDMKGNMQKLSEQKGKVVLLDFTIYQSAVAIAHNFILRELYDKYADRGLEIYQVSLDADEHFWKTSADNLPWICVRDGNGVYSSLTSVYNIQSVPSFFLITRNSELSARGEAIDDLDAAIKALL